MSSLVYLRQGDIKKFLSKLPARFIQFIFYGNFFYGVCVIILSMEASLQQRSELNHWTFYPFIGALAVAYYIIPYIRKPISDGGNQRIKWYNEHQITLRTSISIFILTAVCLSIIFATTFWKGIIQVTWYEVGLLAVFPFSAILYYGVNLKPIQHINLRRTGWLKPFVIGFVWAGLVTVYPIIFKQIENQEHFSPTVQGLLLFLKNFMFISMLGILFDIKDYADDKRLRLPTVVVKTGLTKTLFYIIIPLTLLGLGTFLYYGLTHSFHTGKILLNTIPFLLLMILAYSLKQQKSVLFYFVLVDGLILVKGLCGILAMVYF